MLSLLKDMGRNEQGATAVEYGLIVALIFLAILTAVQSTALTAIEMWNLVSSSVVDAIDL